MWKFRNFEKLLWIDVDHHNIATNTQLMSSKNGIHFMSVTN